MNYGPYRNVRVANVGETLEITKRPLEYLNPKKPYYVVADDKAGWLVLLGAYASAADAEARIAKLAV